MSPSPADASISEESDRYAAAWSRLMTLVRQGHSWSGRERNVALLNDRTGGFADVSAIVGLDHADDGRAIAVTDWDGDGDLDLWMRNRTAPRLRFLRNQHRPAANPTEASSVSVLLQGVSANRDAVGAIVEIIPKSRPEQRLVRSLRAGDLFLSQSGKTLHFGLAEADGIASCTVLWPGGAREVFAGLAPGGHFLLRQGTGHAINHGPTPARADVVTGAQTEGEAEADEEMNPIPVGDRSTPPRNAVQGILMPARIPIPAVSWRDPAGRPATLTFSQNPTLLLLWSAGCPRCRTDLEALASAAPTMMKSAGLRILALSVDGLAGEDADVSSSYDLMDTLGEGLEWGFLDAESADRLWQWQGALFDRTPPPVVPFAVLLDGRGDALAMWRGAVDIHAILAAKSALVDASDDELHHWAPPLAGRWFTNPMNRSDVAEFMARQFQSRLPDESIAFRRRAMDQAVSDERRRELAARLITQCLARAGNLTRDGALESAAPHFAIALTLADDPAAGRRNASPLPDAALAAVHFEYASVLANLGRPDEARTHLLRVLDLVPDSQSARDALDLLDRP